MSRIWHLYSRPESIRDNNRDMTRRRWRNWSSSWFRKCHLHDRDDSSPALPSPRPRSSWWSSTASSCGREGTRAPQNQRSALHDQCLEKGYQGTFWQFITIRAAEELPGVGYAAFVELHGVCVQADRDWAVLEEPLKCKSKKRPLLVEYLGHLGLILWDFNSSGDSYSHFTSVVLASFILTVIPGKKHSN